MKSARNRRRVIGASVAALAFTGVIAVASPASAATASCMSSWAGIACTTGSVSAHPYGHYVRVTVTSSCSNYANWRVFDVSNHVTVASGSTGTTRTINGLYGSYQASVRSVGGAPGVCLAGITLDNDW